MDQTKKVLQNKVYANLQILDKFRKVCALENFNFRTFAKVYSLKTI